MALHWQHIKGINGTNPLYTYLEFSVERSTNKNYLQAPKIYVGTTNYSLITEIKDNCQDLGFILTSDATGQSINEDISIANSKQLIFKDQDSNAGSLSLINQWLKISAQGINLNDCIQISATNTEVVKPINFADNITLISEKTFTSGNTQISSNFIQAPYFNATSDIRAKEDIKQFNNKALDIITNLQTYTYTYKKSKQKSYGLMAQDLLKVNINGFSFVDNAAATGEDDDYMSIHESKLVYLLIEGIKEQQEKIEELEDMIGILQNQIDILKMQ